MPLPYISTTGFIHVFLPTDLTANGRASWRETRSNCLGRRTSRCEGEWRGSTLATSVNTTEQPLNIGVGTTWGLLGWIFVLIWGNTNGLSLNVLFVFPFEVAHNSDKTPSQPESLRKKQYHDTISHAHPIPQPLPMLHVTRPVINATITSCRTHRDLAKWRDYVIAVISPMPLSAKNSKRETLD